MEDLKNKITKILLKIQIKKWCLKIQTMRLI